MGAENSMLKHYNHVADPTKQHIASGRCWTLHQVQHKDGNKLSMFMFSQDTTDLMGLQFWKTLRHPCLVKYYASEVDSGKLCVITEPVKPLAALLDKLTPHEIVCGLHDVLEALCFLHEKVKVSCNNVGFSSIFVSTDGIWKIGALHCINSVNAETKEFIKNLQKVAEEDALPPEDKGDGQSVNERSIHSRDSYGFGCLSEKLLKNFTENDIPGVKEFQLNVIPQLKSSKPSLRPLLSKVKEENLFIKNDFLQTRHFLQNFILKDEKEIVKFTQSLIPNMKKWPEKLIASRLVPLFLSRVVILNTEINKSVLPYLLIPMKGSDGSVLFEGSEIKPLFSESVYASHVVPLICKILCIWEVHIRLRLLEYFKYYVHLIPKKLLKSLILPQLLQGCKDTSDTLVSASLHALADLVPVLGASVVVGGHREKIFSIGFPKVPSKHGSDVNLLKSTSYCPSANELVNGISAVIQDKEKQINELNSMTSGGEETLDKDSRLSWDETDSVTHLQDLERSSPDGGEEMLEPSAADDQEWPGWEPMEDGPPLQDVETAAPERLMSKELVSHSNHSIHAKQLSDAGNELLSQSQTELSSSGSGSSLRNAQKPKRVHRLSEGLGEEYDIMAIEVKPKNNSSEFDFFADMEPAIAKQLSNNAAAKESSVKSSTSSLFAVQSSTAQEVVGWDDEDLEWEVDSSS